MYLLFNKKSRRKRRLQCYLIYAVSTDSVHRAHLFNVFFQTASAQHNHQQGHEREKCANLEFWLCKNRFANSPDVISVNHRNPSHHNYNINAGNAVKPLKLRHFHGFHKTYGKVSTQQNDSQRENQDRESEHLSERNFHGP